MKKIIYKKSVMMVEHGIRYIFDICYTNIIIILLHMQVFYFYFAINCRPFYIFEEKKTSIIPECLFRSFRACTDVLPRRWRWYLGSMYQ